jgi:hypothetical protein
MSFYKASKKSEDVQQGGSNYITKSGIFPVLVLAPVVSVSKGGSTSVDLYVEYQGQKQIVYGNLRITNNDGSPNKIGSKIFNQLVIIAGLDSVSDPVEAELPIGQKEAMKDVSILEDLCDVEVLMRTQMEYGVFNGSITEKKVIKAFFRASDKATAEEIVNETDAGFGYERELKYVDNITFKDDLTEAVVAEWIKAKRPKGTAGGAAAGGSTSKKAPSFGERRFGKSADE